MAYTLHQTLLGDQIETNETGGACSAYGGQEHRGFWWGKQEGKRPLGRPTRTGEDNIKSIFKKLSAESRTGLIWLRKETGGRTPVNAVMILRVS